MGATRSVCLRARCAGPDRSRSGKSLRCKKISCGGWGSNPHVPFGTQDLRTNKLVPSPVLEASRLVGGSSIRQHCLIRHHQPPTRTAPLVRVALPSKQEVGLRRHQTIAPEGFGLGRSGCDRRLRVRHGQQPPSTDAGKSPLKVGPKTADSSVAKTNSCPPVRCKPSRRQHRPRALRCPDQVSLRGTCASHPALKGGALEKTPLPSSLLKPSSISILRAWVMKSSHRRFQPRVMAIALLAPHAPLLAGLSTLSELARHAQTDLRLGALELRRRQRRRHVVATIRDGRILKYLIRHGEPDVRTHAIGSAKASRGIHVAELRLRGSKPTSRRLLGEPP